MNLRFARLLGALAIAGLLVAPSARGEVAAWDQTRVTALAKDLAKASDALYEIFVAQPRPDLGTMQSHAYYRMKQVVRMIKSESRVLAKSLEEGEGREQTVWMYENLMSLTRGAREEASGLFVAQDVGKRAAAVRGVLNQLGPYYDVDFQTIAPHPSIEPGASR